MSIEAKLRSLTNPTRGIRRNVFLKWLGKAIATMKFKRNERSRSVYGTQLPAYSTRPFATSKPCRGGKKIWRWIVGRLVELRFFEGGYKEFHDANARRKSLRMNLELTGAMKRALRVRPKRDSVLLYFASAEVEKRAIRLHRRTGWFGIAQWERKRIHDMIQNAIRKNMKSRRLK